MRPFKMDELGSDQQIENMNVANSNAKIILKEHILKSTQAAVAGCEFALEIWAILKKNFCRWKVGRASAEQLEPSAQYDTRTGQCGGIFR